MKKHKGLFSKVLVSLILVFMALLAIWAFRILSHTGIDPTSLITAVYAFFGFELASLLIKRIFAKEDNKYSKKKNGKDDIYDGTEVDK